MAKIQKKKHRSCDIDRNSQNTQIRNRGAQCTRIDQYGYILCEQTDFNSYDSLKRKKRTTETQKVKNWK